jgi:hypothetical protein
MNERHHHLEPKYHIPPMYIALATNNKEPQPKDISGYLKLLSSCSYHASRNQRMGTILLKYLDLIMVNTTKT